MKIFLSKKWEIGYMKWGKKWPQTHWLQIGRLVISW